MTGARSNAARLGVLTAAKVAANTALRWVGLFLPTLERGFGTTTGTLTGVMGVAELGGLTTLATGTWLDRGRERIIATLGLAAIAASSIIALGGSVPTFALSFVILVVGVSNLTAAGHAWIGHRVEYRRRGRAIGAFETSWAIALLVGAPLIALLITRFGWRGPYTALAIASTLAAVMVVRLLPRDDEAHDFGREPERVPLPRSAWLPMLASASTAAAGLGTFVVSGTWLDERHGVSTGGLGVIAVGFGAIELVSSSAVALVGDRLGVRRSVVGGLALLLVGIAVISRADDSRVVAVIGLLILLAGFEYGIVSSLTLVTEAAPLARGKAIGVSNACGTLARAGAVAASGQLYEAFGINGTLTMAAIATVVAGVLVVAMPSG